MKQYTVILSANAKKDLIEIANYIVEESGYLHIAEAYINRLRDKSKQLSTSPYRGQDRNDLAAGLRILALEKNTLVAFDINEGNQTVEVLNYYHGGRDYDAIMSKQ